MLEIVRNASDYPALLKASLKLERFYALIADGRLRGGAFALRACGGGAGAHRLSGYAAQLARDRDKEESCEFVSTAKAVRGNR